MKELNSILKSIKNKELLPVYFFQGLEPYYIDVALKAFENDVLSDDEKAFGQTVLYGKDTTLPEIISLAQQFPMMGDKNLIIIKEAQDLDWKAELQTEEKSSTNKKETPPFQNYVNNPAASTILVFGYKKKGFDGKKKLTRALHSNHFLFNSEPVKTYHLAKWIAEECANRKIKTEPNTSHLLAEYLGNDLSRIANELQKLQILLAKDQILDSNLIEKHIGISKEYNVFELQKAIGEKNANTAFRIVHFMAKNPKANPIALIIGRLFEFFTQLMTYHLIAAENPQTIATELGISPFFVKDYTSAARNYPLKHISKIISILRETDLKSKGLGANQTADSELLKEMAYKIINTGMLRK